MRQLVVNADDFGVTAQVSRGILDAHREGIVTSTTLMANGGGFDAAVSMSRRAPRLGIGVHLNLTDGQPVSPALRIRSLVDSSGRLHLNPSRLLQALVRRQVNLADVETELRQQIGKVLNAGILPTHLDGHKHVHVLPGVSEIVIGLAQEFSIPSVRCPLEEVPCLTHLLPADRKSGIARVKQYIVGRAVSRFARHFKEKVAEAGLLFPAHFYGLTQTGFLDVSSIRHVLGHLPEGVSQPVKVGGGSYLSSHDPRQILGIGRRNKIDSLEIRWPRPSRLVETIRDLPVDRYITVVEGRGIQAVR